ncbi:hypothetical protein EDD93_2845 [Streptomyces sp. 840.1]|uniref:hypothetical protein n=1 Tax=Streptomyces sp. 840.1 TaxID=2485152 RepID=UPI000F4AE75A|nr:hypothetical protein [Streptomyces sp. 840.1]ROQ68381.1 hypothetical protein EDD93_2845 [Streptomyces sp. 840.1]
MKLTFSNGWRATVAEDPLLLLPRFAGTSVRVVPYTGETERGIFLLNTFGSQEFLWDVSDEFRFAPDGRQLVGVDLYLPDNSAFAEDAARVPTTPAVRPGGLRADEARNFRHSACTVLCRAPEDAVLTCLRDLDVLDEPLDARIGIAPDVALLVQHGAVVGWSLTDPARYLTTPFAAPDADPPSLTTRRLLTECLDLITQPVISDVEESDPAALARLRTLDDALRNQREDRHRADALRTFIAELVEIYAA